MTTLETTQTVPLTIVEGGQIRIAGSRVSLDVVVHHYQRGESPEEIREAFPTLSLADIYAVISYYLNHREEVEEYLRQQEAKAEELRQRIESSPFCVDREGLRERLMARRIVPDKMPIGEAVEELVLIIACSDAGEWENRVVHLPL